MTCSNSPTDRVGKQIRPSKRVRISLLPSPPPDSEMTDMGGEARRRSARIQAQTPNQVVFPTEAPGEIERLRSGSHWRQRDLKLLRVKFDPAEDENLDVLDVDHEWTDSQRRGNIPPFYVVVMIRTELDVESLLEELNSISLETLHDATTKEILELAPRFALFFDQLRTLIGDN